MRVSIVSIGLLLSVVLLIANEVSTGDTAMNVANAGIPDLTGYLGMVLEGSPAGPYVAAGLGLLHVLSMFLLDEEDPNELSKLDLMKTQKDLEARFDRMSEQIGESTSKIINELTYTVQSLPILEGMRTTLEGFISYYKHHMNLILKRRTTVATTESMNAMLTYDSDFRNKLRSFISTFIRPKTSISTSSMRYFFELLQEKHNLLAVDDKDCYHDSLHSKIYKAYMYIAKVLTDTYAMAITAHAIQYQSYLRQNSITDAADIKRESKTLFGQYKKDMKALMGKVKYTLNHSSREIKNCPSFELKEGENCARLPFVTTIPHQPPRWAGYSNPFHIHLSDYETCKCTPLKDFLSLDELFKYYYDVSLDRPYVYMKSKTNALYGHEVSETLKFEHSNGFSAPDFCTAHKKDAVGFSLQRLIANPGNVITGVRWRLSKNIVYMDIQQGKWLNALQVDPNSVVWTETPEDPYQVAFLNCNLTKIEIDDHLLGAGEYLTSVQLDLTKQANAMFKLFIEGAKPPGWNRIGSQSYAPIDSNEIKIVEGDDPVKAAATRRISVPPAPTEPAFIQFQVSSFNKDFSRTTVPYFDTREVVTTPSAPVSGIGIYHEAGTQDGGLLAFKLISPTLAHYVDYNQILNITATIKPKTKN